MPDTIRKYTARYLLLSIVFGLLSACDCMQCLQGYAVDAQTGRPLSGVFYSRSALLTSAQKKYAINDTLHRYHRRTDSTGWFRDWRLANGFTCKPHLVLWLDKDGYRPVRLEWNRRASGPDTVIVALHKTGESASTD